MGAISATDIISIIQSEIENFDFDTESPETYKTRFSEGETVFDKTKYIYE